MYKKIFFSEREGVFIVKQSPRNCVVGDVFGVFRKVFQIDPSRA